MQDDPLDLSSLIVLNEYSDTAGRSIKFECKSAFPVRSCRECLSRNIHKHGSSHRLIQDLNIREKLVYIDLRVDRYLCQDCGVTFYERITCAPERDRMTWRLREQLMKRCLFDTYSRVGRDFNLSTNTIRRIFAEYVDANKEKLVYTAPKVLGIDEAHLNDIMRCVITDSENNLLLDILPDRETPSVIKFLESMQGNQNVQVVTMDMWPAYKIAVSKSLPSAKIVVDKFHVIQLANRTMDAVRKSFMDGLTKAERASLRYISTLMKVNSEDLSKPSQQRLNDWFAVYPALGLAYLLKEHVRKIYKCKNREDAGEAFQMWCDNVPDDSLFFTTMKTYQKWAREIFNYFDYPYTNAFTESANNLIKKIDKEGRSLSFEQLRYKVLFSTKATKLAKYERFDPKSADYLLKDDPKGTMQFLVPINPPAERPKKLIQGFGVDISELIDLLE